MKRFCFKHVYSHSLLSTNHCSHRFVLFYLEIRDITLYWPTLKNFFFNNSCYVFCRLKTTVLKIRAIGTNWIVWFTIRLHFLSRWWYFLSGSVFPVLISLVFWLGICLNITEKLQGHWGTSKFVLKLAPLSIYICWGLDHLSRCRGTFEK